MKKIRCFLAVELSDELAGPVGQLIHQLAPDGPGVKWVEPENLHLTLKFFGDIDELETYDIAKCVSRAIQGTEPFAIRLRGVGAFPGRDRPRTLWVGVEEGKEQLGALQASVENGLGELGYPREARRFEPHLTVGRVRDKVGQRELVSALRRCQEFDCGRAQIDEVVLFSSQLYRSGPVYTRIATCPLGH